MRRNRNRKFRNSYDGVFGNYMPNGNVTVNNITNITNVAHVSGACGHRPFKRHDSPHRHDRKRLENGGDKKPKLLHFYQTCGMCDQDKASRMSEGEFVDETFKVAGYGVQCVKDRARGVGNGVTKMASGVGQMVGSTFRFIASFFG